VDAGKREIASANTDRKIAELTSELLLAMATLKFDLLTWNFLFWIGQLAALTAILNAMLGDVPLNENDSNDPNDPNDQWMVLVLRSM
jgi:hypothetical protein